MNRSIAALVIAAVPTLVSTPSIVGLAPPATPPPAAQPDAAPEAQPMTAEQVLAKVAEVYRTCTTYQDEGEVVIDFDTKQGKWTDRRPFKTAFVRPDRFRYEFTSSVGPGATGPKTRYVVWADGEQIRSWWTLQPKVERHDSMTMALARPTGVSGGSALTVPSMLLDLPHVGRLTQLAQPKLMGEEQIDGVPCLKVEGMEWSGEPTTIWVDKESFLLRKVYEERTIEDFTANTTTTYKPNVGVDIEDDTFSFTPPNVRE